MLLPLDAYTSHDPSIQEIIPIYRNLYMHYDGHDYGVVYDGDAHLLFYRKDLFEKYGAEYLSLGGAGSDGRPVGEDYGSLRAGAPEGRNMISYGKSRWRR